MSEPDLTTTAGDETNVTFRLKRKREDEYNDDLKNYMDEIKTLLSVNMSQQEQKLQTLQSSISGMISANIAQNEEKLTNLQTSVTKLLLEKKSEQDKKFNSMEQTMMQIKEQNSDLCNSMEFMSSKYDEMREKVNTLESERKIQTNYIKLLEDRLNSIERTVRSASIEIRNIPDTQTTKKEQLMGIVKSVGKTLGSTIEFTDIQNIFKLKSKSKTASSSPIIVEFFSATKKDQIILSMKSYIKGKRQLTTEQLKIGGPASPVYISENLTPKTKRIY